jgi:hypothetical protein
MFDNYGKGREDKLFGGDFEGFRMKVDARGKTKQRKMRSDGADYILQMPDADTVQFGVLADEALEELFDLITGDVPQGWTERMLDMPRAKRHMVATVKALESSMVNIVEDADSAAEVLADMSLSLAAVGQYLEMLKEDVLRVAKERTAAAVRQKD